MSWQRVNYSIGIGLVLVAAGVVAYRYLQDHVRLATLSHHQQAEERFLQPLERMVTLEFDDGTPLRTWLDEFTRQSGIRVEIVSGAEEQPDPLPLAALIEISDHTPTQLRVPPLRAGEFLDLLGDLYDVPWVLRADGSVLFNDKQAKEEPIVRQLPLPAELRANEQAEYLELLSDYSSLRLAGRTSDESYDYYLDNLSGLAIVAPPKRVPRVERFGQQVVAALERARVPAPIGTDPADPVFRPHWLEIEPANLDKLAEVLERPLSLNVVDMPWHDLTAEISKQVRFPISMHPKTLYHFQQGNVRATCRLQNVPLRRLLDYLPAQDGLALFPAANGQILVLGARSIADQSHFRLLAAYPVGDLTQDVVGQDQAAQLLWTLQQCTDSYTWALFHQGEHKQYEAFGGRLLIIDERLGVHRQIERLLAALRHARNERVQNVALPEQYENLRPDLQAILQRPVSLQYASASLADIAQDQLDRGYVRLTPVGEARALFKGQSPIWCYLPERPLGENLTTLFAARGHQLIEQRDQLRVHWREQVEPDHTGLACEVFDLRPWLTPKNALDMRVHHAVRYMVEPGVWDISGWNGRGTVAQYRDLLVVRCEPKYLPRVHELLQLLAERSKSLQPNVWRGKQIVGEALHQPLTIWPADQAALAREEQLRQKLREPASASFQGSKLGDAILALASRHQLPIVIRSVLPNSRRLDERITYQATDKPLGEILQEMVGDPDIVEWQVGADCVTIVELLRPRLARAGIWYSVADLVRPHGPHDGEKLVRQLDQQSLADKVTRKDRRISLIHDDFLWLDGKEDDRPWLEEQLRKLRAAAAEKAEAQP